MREHATVAIAVAPPAAASRRMPYLPPGIDPVLLPFMVSRIALLLLTGVIAVARHQAPLLVWDRWDTQWYTGIAIHGYHWSLDGKSALAFFPLYPLFIHLGWLAGLPTMLAGMLMSNTAFLGALFYLHLWFRREWGDVAASRAIWLIALFPTAFFTFTPYTEALFLLTASAAIYHMSRGEGWRAGVWTALSLITRSNGVTLLPALILAIPRRKWMLAAAPAAGAMAVWLWFLTGQGFAYPQIPGADRAWHRGLTYPWTGFTASLQWLIGHGFSNPGQAAENILQLGVTVIFLVLTIMAWRHFTQPVGAYLASCWLVWLTSVQWLDGYFAPFSSMDRFVLALFPLAGWAASRLSARQFRVIACVSGVTMVSAAAVHALGGWVG